MHSHEYFMRQALMLAQQAEKRGEVPVGAVIVQDDEIIGTGYNQPIETHDPSAHAEIVALRDAAKFIGNYRLNNAILYVTLEPCLMCVGAILHARIAHVVFGAKDPKAGAMCSVFRMIDEPRLTHRVRWEEGVCEAVCSELLKNFFQSRR